MFALSNNYLIWELLFHNVSVKINLLEIYYDIADFKLLEISKKDYEYVEKIFQIQKIINSYMIEIDKSKKIFSEIYNEISTIIAKEIENDDYNFVLGKIDENFFKVIEVIKSKLNNNEIIKI